MYLTPYRVSRVPRVTVMRRGSESHEQILVVAHARTFHPDVVIAAVPNGGARRKTEAARLKLEGVLPGYPDLLVDEARGGWYGLRIEMKRADGKGRTSKAQTEILERLGRAGYLPVVCAGAAEAIAELEFYLALPLTRPLRSTRLPWEDPLA